MLWFILVANLFYTVLSLSIITYSTNRKQWWRVGVWILPFVLNFVGAILTINALLEQFDAARGK